VVAEAADAVDQLGHAPTVAVEQRVPGARVLLHVVLDAVRRER
jgi:hypothetical protein